MMDLGHARVGVIGLGYVGLPLAVSFARHFDVVGFDVDDRRIKELNVGHDRTREISEDELKGAQRLTLTSDPAALNAVNVHIITTPTPIDRHKQPDLGFVLAATRTVGAALSSGDVVIYESTVYPGATEEECVPVLEEVSGLTYNTDFFVGYSPERINPGDHDHRFETICKVTSGSTPEAATFVDSLYGTVVQAGTHLASSIKVAEAAKVIENTQRDLNIALVNELALLFNRMGIDTQAVLAAAGTKWNFLPFQPGLVGGHCIGVDPYYLTHKAESIGYHPELILAGRRLNDSMGSYVATQLVQAMMRKQIDLRGASVLILGLTFKENTPDVRNTRVIDVHRELTRVGISVDIHDPWVDPDEARSAYDIDLVESPTPRSYDAVILAVPHADFVQLGAAGARAFGKHPDHVFYDLKSVFAADESDVRL
jgi:UDP-N-acetyl-D-galactosamine dehydrogenase